MTVALRFINDNAIYVYALCGLLAVYYLRVAIRARRERRSSLFPLEREVALGKTYRTLGIALLLLAILGGTWAFGEYVIPRVQRIETPPTPTPNLVVVIDTPTPTPPPPTTTPTPAPVAAEPTPQPTPRLATPTATSAPSSPTPAIRLPLCPNPGAAIASPGNGQIVTGEVRVTGAANINGFQFYKLEWSPSGGPAQWNWFAGSEAPVVGGVLGVFNAAGLPAGAYTIRLVVVDNTGNYPDPCLVTVTIP